MISKEAVKQFLERDLDNYLWIKKCNKEELNEAINSLPTSVSLKNQPFIHQQASVYIGACNSNFLYFLDMGGGKTFITLWLISYYKKLKAIDKTLVIVPNVINIQGWQEEIEKHTKLKVVLLYGSKNERELLLESDADIFVINYDGLQTLMADFGPTSKKRGKKERVINEKKAYNFADLFDLVIFDEIHRCFHSSTLIETIEKEIPINQIKLNDRVKTLKGTYSEVTDVFINKVAIENICKVTIGNKLIICSKDHLFFTENGWMQAKDLKGKFVFFDPLLYNTQKIHEGKNNVGIPVFKNLRMVWKQFSSKYFSSKFQKILQYFMFCKMETTPFTHSGTIEIGGIFKQNQTRSIKPKIKQSGKIQRDNSKNIKSNEAQQPLTSTRNSSESISDQRKKWNIENLEGRTRRKWALHKRTINYIWAFIRERLNLGIRMSSYNGSFYKRQKWLPSSLQIRHWAFSTKNWFRDRWRRTQSELGQIKRQEKRREIERIRVENIEIYKPGSNERSFEGYISDIERNQGWCEFYDLEVKDHPSYYANNIIVHNCKNHRSLTFKLCDIIASSCKYRYGLTGTPFGRNPHDLWTQFYLVDRGQTLGTTLSIFRAAFFTQKKNHWGGYDYKFDVKKEELLNKILQNKSIRYEDKEFADLPPVVHTVVPLRLADDALQFYRETVLESMNAAIDGLSRENYYVKWREICSGFLYVKDSETNVKQELTFSHTEKLDALEEILDDIPKASRLIIFHIFNKSGEIISDFLKKKKIKFVAINSTNEDDSVTAYKKFQSDPKVKVLVANIASGSTGLNLQSANYVVFWEPTDRPIWQKQAEKRVHRHGQTQRVYYYHFITKHTVEEKIRQFLIEGKCLFDALITGTVSVKEAAGSFFK